MFITLFDNSDNIHIHNNLIKKLNIKSCLGFIKKTYFDLLVSIVFTASHYPRCYQKFQKLSLSYQKFFIQPTITTAQKWSFPLRICSVNWKFALSCVFGHIYWRNPRWKTSFFVQCTNLHLNEYRQELHYCLFAVKLDRYVGIFNTLNDLSNKVWQEITEDKYNRKFRGGSRVRLVRRMTKSRFLKELDNFYEIWKYERS